MYMKPTWKLYSSVRREETFSSACFGELDRSELIDFSVYVFCRHIFHRAKQPMSSF